MQILANSIQFKQIEQIRAYSIQFNIIQLNSIQSENRFLAMAEQREF